MLNEHDPDTHTRIVQTDRLDSRYVMGAWLQLVYVSKRTFSSNFFFFFSDSFHPASNSSYQQGSRRCACRWSGKEVG